MLAERSTNRHHNGFGQGFVRPGFPEGFDGFMGVECQAGHALPLTAHRPARQEEAAGTAKQQRTRRITLC